MPGHFRDRLQVALQPIEQTIQRNAHLSNFVVAPDRHTRRQVQVGFDTGDGLFHAAQTATDAAVQHEAEAAEEKHAEQAGGHQQGIATRERCVGRLALFARQLFRIGGMRNEALIQFGDDRLAFVEQLLGIADLAVARLL